MDRALLLRKLFALARERGMDIDHLRSLAVGQGWGASLRVLEARQLQSLVNILAGTAGDGPPFLEFRMRPAPERRRLMGKLSKLLWSQGASWNYADGIARQMYGCDKVDWLVPDRLHAVVAAVSKQAQRRRG